jgi:uncharacterized phage protein gp47/JayE
MSGAQTDWPIPAPGDISDRCAATYEGELDGIDARNPNTVATTNCRVTEMAMQDLYLYQGNNAFELMPDTAKKWLSRHGAIWGVPQLQPVAAGGNLILTCTPGAVLPADMIFSYSGSNTTYSNVAGVTANGSGVASVPVGASLAGTAGNLAAATQLTLTSPVAGVLSQTAVVDSNGITGGLDLEDLDDWRARILLRIRTPAMGGSANDYIGWTKAALPGVGYVSVLPAYGGLPNVGVVFAMSGPSGPVVPSSGQIAAVQAYLSSPAIKPVIAVPVVLAAVLNPLAVTLHLNPDTPAIRAAATAALTLSFQQDAAINGTTYFSRLDNAVSSSDGEYSHDMTLAGGVADVAAPTVLSINTLGTVTFV